METLPLYFMDCDTMKFTEYIEENIETNRIITQIVTPFDFTIKVYFAIDNTNDIIFGLYENITDDIIFHFRIESAKEAIKLISLFSYMIEEYC